MTLDCTNLKPGDKVCLRNGSIDTVYANDKSNIPIQLKKTRLLVLPRWEVL